MSRRDLDETEQHALAWLARVNDPEFADWTGLESWLAEDPRHGERYWDLAEREAEAVDALTAAPIRPQAAVRRRPAAARRGAVAAGLLAAGLGAWIAWTQLGPLPDIATAPGEQRTVALADGSTVSLDGATRLAMSRNARRVRLEAGRALFDVVHDAREPFVVEVGDATLTDLGTVFDVTRLQDGARVAVSEGAVEVEAAGAAATLLPGDSVVVTPSGLDRRTIAPADVASWREARLAYAGEPLSVVAQDLSRALNRPVSVAPAIAGRRFTGSLAAPAGPDELRDRTGPLLDVEVRETEEGWRLEPRSRR